MKILKHFEATWSWHLSVQLSSAPLLISRKPAELAAKKLRWDQWGALKPFLFCLKQLVLSEALRWEFEQIPPLSHSLR